MSNFNGGNLLNVMELEDYEDEESETQTRQLEGLVEDEELTHFPVEWVKMLSTIEVGQNSRAQLDEFVSQELVKSGITSSEEVEE